MSIQESSNFDSEIYELKTTDKAVGGADGISNLQAKQLANRTQWLKQKIEELQGQSLQSLAIDEHGHLIVTLADESTTDLGKVVGPVGVGMPSGGLVGQLPVKKSVNDFDFEWQDKPADGAPGLSVTSATINEAGHLILTLSDASTIDAGEVAGGSTPKPIDLRGTVTAPTLLADPSSTVAPTITELSYSADFSASTGVSVANLSNGPDKNWWLAWKPTTGVTGTLNALVFTDATLGDITYAYVHGIGLQVMVSSGSPSTFDVDFSPDDTVVAGTASDGSYWIATSNVPLASFPATPPLSISSIRVAMGNGTGEVTLSGELIVDKDLLEPALKGYVESEGLPPFGGIAPASLPSDTAVGDTFYVTHGGTFNGLTYADPDEHGNHEGFIVDKIEPTLLLTPFRKSGGGSDDYHNFYEITVGGGEYYYSGVDPILFSTLQEAVAAMRQLKGNLLKVNIGDISSEVLDYIDISFPTFALVNFNFMDGKTRGGVWYGGSMGCVLSGNIHVQDYYTTFNKASGSLNLDSYDAKNAYISISGNGVFGEPLQLFSDYDYDVSLVNVYGGSVTGSAIHLHCDYCKLDNVAVSTIDGNYNILPSEYS